MPGYLCLTPLPMLRDRGYIDTVYPAFAKATAGRRLSFIFLAPRLSFIVKEALHSIQHPQITQIITDLKNNMRLFLLRPRRGRYLGRKPIILFLDPVGVKE